MFERAVRPVVLTLIVTLSSCGPTPAAREPIPTEGDAARAIPSVPVSADGPRASQDAGRPPDGAAVIPPGLPSTQDGAAPSGDAGPASSVPRQPGAHPSDAVFDDGRLETYTVTIAPADLANMQANALKETYVPATLKVGDEDVGKVAVRFKGGWNTLAACVKDGKIICKKMSYKLKFSEYEPEKRWRGLKRLNLHSLITDRTQLHERLGYRLFSQMGVIAPRSVHALLVINGERKGLYAVTEAPDGRMMDRHFPAGGDGNLYKEVWPRSVEAKTYVAKLRTNEEMPKVDRMIAFARALNQSAPADLRQVAESWLDVDYMLRFIAVDRAMKNVDGPLAFYCFGSAPCESHNFYWYESDRENRVWLIPWDLDYTFAPFPGVWEAPSAWNQPPANCNTRYPLPNGGQFAPPGCDRLFQALAATGRDRYKVAVKKLLDEVFIVDRMRADIDRWTAQISEAVKADAQGPGFDAWKGAVASWKQDLATLRQQTEKLRDGL